MSNKEVFEGKLYFIEGAGDQYFIITNDDPDKIIELGGFECRKVKDYISCIALYDEVLESMGIIIENKLQKYKNKKVRIIIEELE